MSTDDLPVATPSTSVPSPATGLSHRARMYLELIRFSHTVFALPFALVAALLAARVPLHDGTFPQIGWRQALGLLLCMVLARSAAMAFNRLVDRDLDAQNPRTAMRHLPAGLLKVSEVAAFCWICALGFIAATALFLPNWLPLAASVPVLAWLGGYSFAKRFTSAAHLWLGVALALAPLCAWVAVRGSEVLHHPLDALPALVLALAVAFWVAGFDIIYACQDAQFDQQAKLNSIPARFGIARALRLAALLHAGMLVVLAGLPLTRDDLGLGLLYAAAWAMVSALLIVQHALVRPDDLQRVGFAFFQINAIISLVLMSCVALDSWLG